MNLGRVTEALLELDPDNEDHWSLEGLPLVDVVASIAGTKLKRQDITNAAPEFNRDRARELRTQRTAAAHAPRALNGADEDTDQNDDGVPEASDARVDGEDDQPEPAPISALKMNPNEVMKSRSLTELALQELEELSQAANERKKTAEKDLDSLNFQIQIMSRHLERMSRTAADPHAENIRAYHEQTQRSRNKRVEAAQRFIAAGTTPKAVMEQLSTTSPIDRAMARKTARGTQRPNIPLTPAAKAS